jgi:hypothetical protein
MIMPTVKTGISASEEYDFLQLFYCHWWRGDPMQRNNMFK